MVRTIGERLLLRLKIVGVVLKLDAMLWRVVEVVSRSWCGKVPLLAGWHSGDQEQVN